MSLRITLVLAALLCSPLVRADIFKCVDEAGHVTYTNNKTSSRGCGVLARDQAVSSVSGGGRPAAPSASPGGAAGGSAGFPRVDVGTQKARDSDRRRILEDELNSEKGALDVANRQLAEQDGSRRGGAERQSPLRDKVQLHERNIEALKREISNLR